MENEKQIVTLNDIKEYFWKEDKALQNTYYLLLITSQKSRGKVLFRE